LFFALSVPGWSQPAQQPAQPPLVVKVEMPPTNPWTHLAEPVVPGIIGFLSAIIAVWLTQRNQRRLEFHKAELAAKYKSRDSRWTFRKDVYVNLINATTDLDLAFSTLLRLNAIYDNNAYDREVMPPLKKFLRYAALAPIATADPVPALVSTAAIEIMRIDHRSQTESDQVRTVSGRLYTLRSSLQKAGRKDLWGLPDVEAEGVSATPKS
jgi:hypothetical protein